MTRALAPSPSCTTVTAPVGRPRSAVRVSGMSLRQSVLWVLLGSGSYAICQWAMLIAMTKLGTPEAVGRFALGLSITAPIMMFSSLQLRTLQATDSHGINRLADYAGLRLITTTLALAVIAAVAFTSGYARETAWVILAMGLSKGAESFSDVLYGLLHRQERFDRIAASMLLKGPLSLLALGLGVYLTGSVLWGVVGMMLATTATFVFYDLPLTWSYLVGQRGMSASAASWLPSRAGLLRLAWTGLPLGIVVGLNSLIFNFPQYVLENQGGERMLGMFAALAVFVRIGFLLEQALGQSALPRLSRLFADGNRRAFLLLLGRLLGCGAIIGGTALVAAILFGRQMLTFLYSAEYAQHQTAFAFLMVSASLCTLCGFMKTAADAARRFSAQLPLFGVVVVVAATASVMLVPSLGILGAALSLAIARITMMAGYALVLLVALKSIPNVGKR